MRIFSQNVKSQAAGDHKHAILHFTLSALPFFPLDFRTHVHLHCADLSVGHFRIMFPGAVSSPYAYRRRSKAYITSRLTAVNSLDSVKPAAI